MLTPQEIGSVTRDFENSALGQCYAAFDEKVLNPKLENFNEIRKNHYVFNSLDNSSHICTLAVPVWNFENRVVGVLVASDLASETTNREELAREFIQIAERISHKLGYRGNFND